MQFVIKYPSAGFLTFYKQQLINLLKVKEKMGKKIRTVQSKNIKINKYNQDLLENKENVKNIAILKGSQKKYIIKSSDKSSINTTSTKIIMKPKIKSSDKIACEKQIKIILNRCDDAFNSLKTLKDTQKISVPMIYDSTQTAESKLIKNFSKKNSSLKNEACDSPTIKDFQKENTLQSHSSNIPEECAILKKGSRKNENLSGNECHSSLLRKEAFVIIERCEAIEEMMQSCGSLKKILEDSGKTKEAANKSRKGTKRKREEKNKAGAEDNKKPRKDSKQEASNQSKKSKKEQIPDVTAIDFSNNSKSPNDKEWNFKISSWNVNGIRAWLEKNGLSYLHHEQPDILCIQETKCSDDKIPDEVKEIEGYHAYWLSGDKDGYSGVGLLTKEKPIKIEYGIGIAEHDNEGRVITAEYDKFYLVSTYVPNAGRGLVRLDYRMKWDKDFREYLKKLDAQKPVILCGDLNVAHEEIDLANPKTNKKNAGFTKEEREGFSTLLKECGFIDSFRHLYPDVEGAYTFWTYMMNARAKNVGWRLDYFVISERFTENLCDNVIRKDVFGSDHCPITLFLSL